MMYARVKNNVIVNVIETDEHTPDWRGYIPLPENAWIGWVLIDGVWTDPNLPAPDDEQEMD